MFKRYRRCLAALSAAAVFASHSAVAASDKADMPYSIKRFDVPGITVTTTPLFNARQGAYDSDILYNLPSINEDLMLLRQRKAFYEVLAKKGLPVPDHAIIGISGALEASATHTDAYSLNSTGGAGSVDLSTAELDVSVLVNPWATGYFSLDYDSSPASTGSREENSRLYLQRGFVTVGDLSKSPFYITAGQMYAPFGLYHSLLLTTPVTKSMGRVLERMVLVGWDNGTTTVSLYGYHSDIAGSNHAPFNQGGVNLLLKKQLSSVNTRFSVGVISNIADSQGMLRNGLAATSQEPDDQFRGFSYMQNSAKLNHGVPAVALDAIAQWRDWAFTAGYVGSLTHFSVSDMQFNDKAALPAAFHTELNYVWHWHAKPISVGVTYGHTWQALALNLPQDSIGVVGSMSPWKDVTVGLEYRHGINYTSGTTAEGRVSSSALWDVYDIQSGGHQDSVTLKLGVYF